MVTNRVQTHNPLKFRVYLSHTDSPSIRSTVNWFACGGKKNKLVIPVKININNARKPVGCKLNASISNQKQRSWRWAWKWQTKKIGTAFSPTSRLNPNIIYRPKGTRSDPSSCQRCLFYWPNSDRPVVTQLLLVIRGYVTGSHIDTFLPHHKLAQDPGGAAPLIPLPSLFGQCFPVAPIRCYQYPSKHLRGTLEDHWSHYHEK